MKNPEYNSGPMAGIRRSNTTKITNTHRVASTLPSTFGTLSASVTKVTFPKKGSDKYLGNALMKALPEVERDRIKGRALPFRRD